MISPELVSETQVRPVTPFSRVLCAIPSRRGRIALERGELLPVAPDGRLIALALNGGGQAAELSEAGAVPIDAIEGPAGAPPAEVVSLEAARQGAELIVVPHERHGLKDRLFGSLAEHVVRQAHMPVLVINQRVEAPYQNILVAVDFDDSSRAALEAALRLAYGTGASIRVLHVYDTSYALVLHNAAQTSSDVARYMEEQREQARVALDRFIAPYRAEHPGLETLLQSGAAQGEVRKVANRCESDLVVVGQHGFKNVAHALLGSVAEATLRGAQCDVLVASPPRQEPH